MELLRAARPSPARPRPRPRPRLRYVRDGAAPDGVYRVQCFTALPGSRLLVGALRRRARTADMSEATAKASAEMTALTEAKAEAGAEAGAEAEPSDGGEDGEGVLFVWDGLAGQATVLETGHTCPVSCLARLADGRAAVGFEDGTLGLLWLDPPRFAEAKCHRDAIAHIQPAADRLLTFGLDNTVRAWSARNLQSVQVHDSSRADCEELNPILDAVELADGSFLCSEADSGEVIRIALGDDEAVVESVPECASCARRGGIVALRDGGALLVDAWNEVVAWDPRTRRVTSLLEPLLHDMRDVLVLADGRVAYIEDRGWHSDVSLLRGAPPARPRREGLAGGRTVEAAVAAVAGNLVILPGKEGVLAWDPAGPLEQGQEQDRAHDPGDGRGMVSSGLPHRPGLGCWGDRVAVLGERHVFLVNDRGAFSLWELLADEAEAPAARPDAPTPAAGAVQQVARAGRARGAGERP